MKILKNPERRYGRLPKMKQVHRLMLPHPHLQQAEGALEYLEKHLARVEENYPVLCSEDRDMWSIMLRAKAKKAFTNTTRALRVIMVYHHKDTDLLDKMALRLKEVMEQGGELVPHYQYLLTQLAELGSKVAEKS